MMGQNNQKSLGEIRTEEAFRAAVAGDLERLKWLVECGFADAGEYTSGHNSLLYAAVRSGNMEIVRYLTERVGLNPLAANLKGETSWDLAKKNGNAGLDKYFATLAGDSYENTYHNPIRRGFFPDPSIVRVENDFYMVNSSFCFFPCIPVSHSRDLIHWEIIGYAITEPAWAEIDDLNGGMGYWAPDISYYNGRFYITATLRKNDDCEKRRVQMVTSSAKAEGPYEKPVFLDIDGIDPSIFRDDDGKTYMLVNRGARLFELSEDCKTVLDDKGLLWYGDNKRKPEGPHLLKQNGYYYLFLAEGGTGMGHCITVARSKTLEGPYEPCPHNPIMHQWDQGALIQCTGHGKPIQLQDGRWYIAYLCLRKPEDGYGIIGRETCLDPMEWTPEGWPRINGGRGPSGQQKLPFVGKRFENMGDRMEKKEQGYPRWQGKDWMTPRTLSSERLAVRNDVLFLRGSLDDLNTSACRSVFVKRQEKFVFTAMLTYRIPDLIEGQSLGLTCYYDENSYLKYGVSNRAGRPGILLQEYVGDGLRTDLFRPFAEDEITADRKIRCKVAVNHLERTFSYDMGKGWVVTEVVKDTSYLSSEGLSKGKRFTGATQGVYVHGAITGEFLCWEEDEKQ